MHRDNLNSVAQFAECAFDIYLSFATEILRVFGVRQVIQWFHFRVHQHHDTQFFHMAINIG
jgi:hypothetical protein